MKISKFVLVLAAILPLTLSATWVSAQHPGNHSGHHPSHEAHRTLTEFGFTEEQLRSFHLSMTSRRENQHALQQLQQTLNELAYSDNYNVAEAENLIREYNENLLNTMVAATQEENNFYLQLTQEQKQAIAELMERHRPHR